MGKKDKRMVAGLAGPTNDDGAAAAAVEDGKKRKKDKPEPSEQATKAKKPKISDEGAAFESEPTIGKKKKKKGSVSENGEVVKEEAPNGSVVGEKEGPMENGDLKKKKKKRKQEEQGVGLDIPETNGVVSEGEIKSGKEKKKEKKKRESNAGGVVDVSESNDRAGEENATGGKTKIKGKKEGNGLSGDGNLEEGLGKKGKKKEKGSGGKVGGSLLSGGGDLATARAALNMVVTGRDADAAAFKPLDTFAEANLPEVLLHGCAGFAAPSPIQAQAWPIALAGRDLIGIAKTGSGKTIAFAVPALSHITKLGKPPKSPACLVLAPTRELAIQIAEVFENAGKQCGVKTVCVYGGVPKGPQKAAIRAGATVVVATPGRLQDLMEEGACSLTQCGMLVLDEADRMLDLGFEPAIRKIIGLLPKAHQTSMFSATWPPEVAKLAAEFLRDPLKITIGSEDLTANHDVRQIVEVCEPTGREPKLEQLLRKYHADRKTRVLVFVLYKKEAAQMESYLTRKGWKAVAIHGDKGQADRSRALQQFRDGSIPLLIATDVAARGLDIPDVEYVINYSFPLTAEDYVHRIGRTGRAGKKGIAHTFFTVNDKARAGELQNILREAGQEVPTALTAFGTTVKKKESKLYGAHFREVNMEAKATKISFDSDDE